MAFDPSIILGYRGVEIPNQLAQYAQMAQVENAQQQNALARFQLGAAQRAEQGQTALGQAYGEFYGGGGSMGGGAAPGAADLTAAYGGGGTVMGGAPSAARGELPYANMRQAIVNKLRTTAPNLIPAELARINEMEQKALQAKKTQTEIDTAGLTQQKTRQELVTTRTAQFRDQLSKVNSPEAAAQWTIAMYNDPQLKDTISSVPLEAALAEIPRTPQEFNVWKNQNALGMAKFIELNKPTTTAGPTGIVQIPGLGGPATVVPGTGGAFQMTPAQIESNKIARDRLAFEQGKFAWEKANPGFELKQAEDGSIVGVNKRTLQAFPVMLEATTPAPQTGAGGPANMLGQQTPMAPLKGKDASKTAVSEQQASYNLGRVLTAASQINEIGKKDPDAVKPGGAEALAASIGMGGTANLARNANRQIVFGAQRDALDALLYLATGAAYNKEQLEGQMAAYIPSFTDKPETVTAKKARMTELIKSAKTRAGKAWTPEMDAAMSTLTVPTAEPTPGASQGTGGFKYLGKESTK